MSNADQGGDPACWSHLFDDDPEPNTESTPIAAEPVVVDLRDVPGAGGAVWSLPHGGDLDTNLVRLAPGSGVGSHVNTDVDVLLVVEAGTGQISIDDSTHQLGPGHLVLVPRGSRRSVDSGPSGLTYLSIHRRREGIAITRRPRDPQDE